jgi:hypothetical protein
MFSLPLAKIWMHWVTSTGVLLRNYTLTFSSTELNQLLKLLYYQDLIADQAAIEIIAKINTSLQTQGNLQHVPGMEVGSHDPQTILSMATDTYYRYREQYNPGGAPSWSAPPPPAAEQPWPEQPWSSHALASQGGHNGALQSRDSDPFLDHSGAYPGGFGENQQLLNRIAQSLDVMANYFVQQNPLGFRQEAVERVIYCDASQGGTWYYLGDDDEPMLIFTPVLTCKVQRLEFTQVDQGWKLRLHVMADRAYCLEGDYNSAFSKAMLLALASLSPQKLRQPVIVECFCLPTHPEPTCRLYSNGAQVLHSFGTTPKWRDIARQALLNVEGAQE